MNEQDPPTTSDGLSDGQQIVIILLQICSASLSAIGSFMVAFKILRDRIQIGSMMPYERFMLGLSTCDIVASIFQTVQKFLLPRQTSPYIWAFGSPATCQASGFFHQLIGSAIWYNFLLNFYFLLTTLSQLLQKNLVRKCEPWMHISGLFFPITAIMGLRRGWYGLQGFKGICWFTDPGLQWILGGVPVLFTYFFLIIDSIVIYVVIRKSLQSSEHVAEPTLVQKRLKMEARTLMFLYVGCFSFCITPGFVLSVLEANFGYTKDNVGELYPLIVADQFLWPLQGFFNFFIYIKPMYTRFRATNPGKPIHSILYEALFNPNVPQLTFSNDESDTNATANPNETLFNSNFGRNHTSKKWFSSRYFSSKSIAEGDEGSSEDSKEEE